MSKGILPERVSRVGIDLIKGFEGFQPQVYSCPGGYPTIGFGHVIQKGEDFGENFTIRDGTELLKKDLQIVEKTLHDSVIVPLTVNQFDAVASLVFNIGMNAWMNSTFLQRLNNREDLYEVSSEFLRWIFAGPKRLKGLMRRREAERNLFIKGIVFGNLKL